MAHWAVLTLVVVTVAAAAGLVCSRRYDRSPLIVIVLVALVVRVLVAILSRGHTPADIGIATQNITHQIHLRRDPLTSLPRFRWNFLPFMPTLYALLDHLGLPWQYTVKIPAIAADLVCTGLVGALASVHRRRAQWLYATNPVCVLVSAVHGQVEPTALAFGLGALVVVRRSPAISGLLIGFAVSAKTWPVIFLPGLLRSSGSSSWWKIAVAAVVAPVLFILEGLWLLNDSLSEVVHRLVGYRSFIGTWGWTGLLHFYGRAGIGYAGPQVDHYQRLGSLLLAGAAVVVFLLLRRRSGAEMVLGLMFVFYATTAGFGPQYLMWAVPLVLTQVRWTAAPFLILSSAFCATTYLYVLPAAVGDSRLLLAIPVFGSVPVILAALAGTVELVWRAHARVSLRATSGPAGLTRTPVDRRSDPVQP